MIRPTRIWLLCLAIPLILGAQAAAAPDVSLSVWNALDNASDTSTIELIVNFDNDLNTAALKAVRQDTHLSRIANYKDVMGRLLRNRDELQSSVQSRLDAMKAAGDVLSYKFFTVSKTMLVRTRAANFQALLNLPGVSSIALNEAVTLIDPVEVRDAPVFAKATTANAALDAMHIRSLWNRGLTGAGRLICSFDTGIDGDHPALAAKWRGNNGGTVAESWFAPHAGATPVDNIGHGTHVMGIMEASTATDTIGVCPDAQWISAAVIDQGVSFSTTIADILSAFDWVLDPDGDVNTVDDVPDVICNSWGVPRGIYSDCDRTFWNAIDNVEAAGIVTIFAAGNEGPNPRSMRNPADRASSPVNTLSVGAIDPLTGLVADFSSRGPASCDGITIKPELVAPGVLIYSTYKDGTYKYMSGTSMAAPFVAGLVALMRQYNPDATVTEIKQALMQAAVDMGPAGEDNSYGRGMVDASKLLDYLPAPQLPTISVTSHIIASGGDAYADPGETADVTMTINDPAGLTDSVDVYLTSPSDWITIEPDTVRFRFGESSTYAVGSAPFRCQISSDAVSGQAVPINVHIRFMQGRGEDSTIYAITIGHALPGRMFTVGDGDLRFSASDFGQFGFGPGSIYQAGGSGLIFRNSQNLLYEGGIVAARNAQLVSDGIRNADGGFKVSDFVPAVHNLSFSTANFSEDMTADFSDDNAALPMPIQIEQALYGSTGDYAVIQLVAINPVPERLDHLAFGVFYDFDLAGDSDLVGFDSLMGMLYQYNPETGLYVGLVGVSANEFIYTAGQNYPDGKRGFTKDQKLALVDGDGIRIDGSGRADWYLAISRSVNSVEAFGRCKLAVVLAAGASLDELRAAAADGLRDYDAYLDTGDDFTALPTELRLEQNFPNPFNPRTTIRFAVTSAQDVTLTVYNVAGQKVRTLYRGRVLAGEQSVVWDGRDDAGGTVATGVYIYRLTAESGTQTRKMVFLK